MVPDLKKLVRLILQLELQPVIVFAFSKRDCEAYAASLNSSKDVRFNSEDEAALVTTIYTAALEALSEEDRALPALQMALPLLRRGIGFHHGGLLPILKEVVEILFQEGLIKVLFATETFSMGINMPARTVVFTAARKFDGIDFRWLSSGEYIQMSGRAGRRGLDDQGVVILMVESKIEPATAKAMLYGSADPLYSTFHLGYNMGRARALSLSLARSLAGWLAGWRPLRLMLLFCTASYLPNTCRPPLSTPTPFYYSLLLPWRRS